MHLKINDSVDASNFNKLIFFVKNYKKLISNNSNKNNEENKKILTIFACHADKEIKFKTILNNIQYLMYPNNEIIIVNSANELYNNELKNYLDNHDLLKNIVKYVEIPNDKNRDIGKFVFVLNNILSDNSIKKDYDFVVLVNDSIIIKKSLRYFYNTFIKINKELFAYNDSSEIKYHYQSYLFSIKFNAIHKFIDHFNNNKNDIHVYMDLVLKIELELVNIYANNCDCFLKIANLPINSGKNIYFNNHFLYNMLYSSGVLPFIKLRALTNDAR